MGLVLPRRAVLAAPALVLPHRRANAQMMQGIIAGKSVAPGPFWTLINSTSVLNNTSGSVDVTMDTTGANFICASLGFLNGPATLTDTVSSSSNTWTQPASELSPGLETYIGSLPAVVGSGHTFHINNNAGAATRTYAIIYAFKSASGTPFVDSNGGNGIVSSIDITSGTTVTTSTPNAGACAPSGSNRLFWSAFHEQTATAKTYSVNNSLAIPIQIAATGTNVGGAGAWGIGGSPITVTWTLSIAIGDQASCRCMAIGSV